MAPKRKWISSAHSTRQAKKRKRNQRQSEQQHLGSHTTSKSLSLEERRHKCNAEAHGLASLNLKRRQLKQERMLTLSQQYRNVTHLLGTKFVWKTQKED